MTAQPDFGHGGHSVATSYGLTQPSVYSTLYARTLEHRDTAGQAWTVGKLRAELARYPEDTPVRLTSPDGEDFALADVGYDRTWHGDRPDRDSRWVTDTSAVQLYGGPGGDQQ